MNPYEKYQQQVVTTMTQGEMLLRLYDETLKQIDLARAAITSRDQAAMGKAIEKAERIVRYLRSVLDKRIPISAQLSKLYDFFGTQLVMANVKKDVRALDDIQPLIQELRDTYAVCIKMERSSRAQQIGAMGNVV